MTDEKKIEELRKGNHSVFKHFYKHFSMIETMILNNNGTKEDAKDIFQNTLIVFYKNALNPNFVLQAKISTYLYSVSKRLWMRKLKKDKPHLEMSITNDHDFKLLHENQIKLVETPPTPLHEYIIKKLDELGEPCKSIIVMHEYNKLKMSEITTKLGYANEHTTRQQKYKCLLKLRKMIPIEVKEAYITK